MKRFISSVLQNNINSEVSGNLINILRKKKKRVREGVSLSIHFNMHVKNILRSWDRVISKSRRVFPESVHERAVVYRVVVSQTRKKNI